MNQGLIPSRYAKAFFEYAQENGADKAVFDMMERLAGAFASEPGLRKVTDNPFIPAADKKALMETAAGPDAAASDVFKRMLDLLVHNGRLDMMRDIAIAYVRIFRERHDIRPVTVTSAAPLDPALEKRLKSLIQSHLPAGATMEYHTAVNPDLIGGFTVSIDNEKLDASIANELKQLRLRLTGK